VGLAAAEGRLGLDDEVLKAFPDDAPARPSEHLGRMRLRDLLRMSTGHQTEPAFWLETAAPDSARGATWVRRFLAHPVPFKPGTHFLYNTPATYMLSAAVQRRTGQTVLDYLRPRLFAPLGIEAPAWDASPEGVTLGGYGLRARTEDVAKFGQLYLQRGVWNGRRLLPAAWVDEATARQTSNGSNPASDWDQGYGYQFWRSRHGSYRGDGAFGQYVLVLPEQDAVVAITSGVRDMQAVMDLVWDRLLPAMAPAALADDPAAAGALRSTLAGLSVRPPGRPRGRSARGPVSGGGTRSPRTTAACAPSRSTSRAARRRCSCAPPPARRARPSGSARGRAPRRLRQRHRAPAQRAGAAGGRGERGVDVRPRVHGEARAPETPFSSTLDFRFDGDRLVLDSRHHVNFGPTALPRLEGRAAAAQ
jgi:hypothetical protein